MDFLDKIGNIAKNIGDRTNDAIADHKAQCENFFRKECCCRRTE